MVQHMMAALQIPNVVVHIRSHTGNSVFLLLNPILSARRPIYGPTTGIFLAKPAIVPRKSPNKTKIP